MDLDEIDREIIKNLKDDGRMSFRELGEKLGVPHTTIFTRVNKLMDGGVIKNFSAIVHPHEIGFGIGFVIIDSTPAQSKLVAKHIARFPEVRKVFRTLDGKVIVKAVFPENSENDEFERFLEKLGDYSVKIYPVQEVVKFDHGLDDHLIEQL